LITISNGIGELVKKMHFGNLAVKKGYITPEQLQDVFAGESED